MRLWGLLHARQLGEFKCRGAVATHTRGTGVPGLRRRRGGEEGYSGGTDVGSLQERGRRGSYGSLGGFIGGVRRPDNKARIGNGSASVAHLPGLGMTILVPWRAGAGGVDAV